MYDSESGRFGRSPGGLCVAAGLAALLTACTDGGGGGSKRTLSVAAGTTFSVPSDRLSLEIDGKRLESVSVASPVDGVDVQAFEYDGKFYVLGLPIEEGVNDVVVTGTYDNGSVRTRSVDVTSLVEPSLPVKLDVSPATGEGLPHPAELRIATTQARDEVERVFLDLDGDGVFDSDLPFDERLEVEFVNAGPLRPSVTLRMRDGRLMTSDAESTPLVSVLAPSPADPARAIADAGTTPVELQRHEASGELFVLDSATPAVRRFNSQGTLIATIALPDLSQPGGMDVDEDGNLFVADTGGDRVLKLVRQFNYQPDPLMPFNGFFGETGTGEGQFDGPTDVCAIGRGLEQVLFVADAGNARVQRFNRAGVFELAFDGADSDGGALAAPARLIPAGRGVRVLDGARVCTFTEEGVCSSEFGGAGGLGAFGGARGLGQAADASLVLADTTGGRVQFLGADGSIERSIAIDQGAPTNALVLPSTTQPLLYVLTEGGTGIDVHPLSTDPDGTGPLAAVERFLAAVQALDWDAARLEVDAKGQDLITLIEESSDARDMAVARMQAFGPPVLHRRTNWSAIVLLEDGARNTDVEFVLHRDPQNGRWALGVF